MARQTRLPALRNRLSSGSMEASAADAPAPGSSVAAVSLVAWPSSRLLPRVGHGCRRGRSIRRIVQFALTVPNEHAKIATTLALRIIICQGGLDMCGVAYEVLALHARGLARSGALRHAVVALVAEEASVAAAASAMGDEMPALILQPCQAS
eukprot:NODE_23411_length_667_cov_4.448148.p1 GENE.NODE_23411_length_667_cov_4.448148~~NODE_23411_length_667_cov_4.448148.p1  ORF type:complete len:152 (+),score=23.79 NODE_23411_length_667_cov_4.448148:117-572(+)